MIECQVSKSGDGDCVELLWYSLVGDDNGLGEALVNPLMGFGGRDSNYVIAVGKLDGNQRNNSNTGRCEVLEEKKHSYRQ